MEEAFADRQEAGRALAARLAATGPGAGIDWRHAVVLALPRGGVPVAVEVAAALGAELDVLIVRKLGAPSQPELGLGALAEGGEPLFDAELVRVVGVTRADLAAVVAGERHELARRVAVYRGGQRRAGVAGRDAVLVDDGLATGGTARAGLRALRAQGARRVVLAAPVAPPDTVRSLRGEADDVVVLRTPSPFHAVGAWYRSFPQLADDEVVALLAAARGDPAPG